MRLVLLEIEEVLHSKVSIEKKTLSGDGEMGDICRSINSFKKAISEKN